MLILTLADHFKDHTPLEHMEHESLHHPSKLSLGVTAPVDFLTLPPQPFTLHPEW